MTESSSDNLFKEYSAVFDEFDDLTLARWLAQTLGQLRGRVWRFSHPLVGAYRLAAEIGHRRQIWLKRLANVPQNFADAPCCRAPTLPLFSRDILQSGLICQHCSEMLMPFEDLPAVLQPSIKKWAEDYAPVHAVAHWEDTMRRKVRDYDQECEDAAGRAEKLLAMAGSKLLPPFLDHFSAIIWEDQDECLEVRPEDIAV
ncbi:MAG TPA: hypothetical protein VH595_21370 [Verrucomicrobiae bacterium]|jgi:hypothetical protein|nr:hypothetical protein [Verrucomicrobiae bacterium]